MPVSKYEKIYDSIGEMIDSYPKGTRLPSVRDFMRKHSVSQATVDKALTMLTREGKIVREAGRGLFVATAETDEAKVLAKDICIMVSDFPSEFFSHVSREMYDKLSSAGFIPRIERFSRHKSFTALLRQLKADAYLITPDPGYFMAEEIQLVQRLDVPSIFLDTIPTGMAVDGVSSDNEMGGAMAADHLIKLGHQKLLVIDAGHPNPNTDQRLKSFCHFAKLMKVEQIEHVCCFNQKPGGAAQHAYDAVSEIFTRNTEAFTGVFVTTNMASTGVLKAFHDLGIKVPEKVSVIGYGFRPDLQFMVPALTSIDQDIKGWCDAVIEILTKRLKNSEPFSPCQIQVEPILSQRSSTAKYAG